MTISKSILLLASSLILLVITFSWFDPESVLNGLAAISVEDISLAISFIFLSYLTAFLRFKLLIDNLHVGIPRGLLFKAYSVGHVGNLLFFNIVGQSISRAFILRKNGVSSEEVVALTYYERILSAFVLLLGMFFGLFFLFPNLQIDFQKGANYLIYFFSSLGIVLVFTCMTIFSWRDIKKNIIKFADYLYGNKLSIFLTVLLQLFMLSAYASILLGLIETHATISIFAALLIVMFAASLPISFSGWGVRELSAASALIVVGIDPAVSIAMAIAIGLLSQILVYIIAILSVVGLRSNGEISEANNNITSNMKESQGKLIQVVVFLMSILIYFQVWIPINGNTIAVNLADVLAFTCLGLFAIRFFTDSAKPEVPKLLIHLLAGITFVLIFSLAHGYFRYGFISWAVSNRGVGWLVLLGYISSGILFTHIFPEKKHMLLKAVVLAAVSISVIQIIVYIHKAYNPSSFNGFLTQYFSGYASNTNAYAFQLLMSFCALIILGRFKESIFRDWFFYLSLVILTVNLFHSYSRAGIIMFLTLSLIILRTPLKACLSFEKRNILLVLITLFCLYASPYIEGIKETQKTTQKTTQNENYMFQRSRGDAERWASIKTGWQLFLENPIFGAGLGANIYQRTINQQTIVVIHSIPVWFLAEFGLIGTCLISYLFLRIIRRSIDLLKYKDSNPYAFGVIGIIACMFIAGLVHDFFYQRLFWFLLGIFMAVPIGKNIWDSDSSLKMSRTET